MRKSILFLLILMIVVPGISVPVSAQTYDLDSGFRPNIHGFSFPNYGNQVCSGYWSCERAQNLTSIEMRRLFGDQVCKTVYADGTCDLLRVAQSWMSQVNQTMAGGHCEGMAVLSTLFYSGIETPAKFGANTPYRLDIQNNSELQRELAYWFATQWFMDGHLIENDPTSQLKILVQAFQENPELTIPIGMFKRDMTGGHAITAYAIEDKGNGIFWIMVYDNNYPNEERHITVDTNNNAWVYRTATMAGLAQDVYEGSGKKNPFQISPVDSRLGQFECDFCPPGSQPGYSPSSPAQPSQPLFPSQPTSPEEGESIFDLILPMLFPDMVQPTAVPTQRAPAVEPTQSGESIFDLLAPWLFPDSVQPTAAPIIQPTRQPQQPAVLPVTKDSNKITVNKDINIYVESDSDQRAGYDWLDGNSYAEIPGVNVTRSVFRSSATIPTNLKYYVWINAADQTRKSDTFNVEVTSPGTVLRLENVLSSYREPNFVYNPPVEDSNREVKYEAFEIMADALHLPRVEFNISDRNGEYQFTFITETPGNIDNTIPLDFVIYHDYEYGQIGIWITTADEKMASQLRNSSFNINGEFKLWDAAGVNTISTGQSPINLDINGMFFFNYKNWLDGKGYYYSADVEGDGEFETWQRIR